MLNQIGRILDITDSTTEDVSLNLKNQPCGIIDTRGKYKTSKRTVYHVFFEGNTLVGSIRIQDNWVPYQFDRHSGKWKKR